MWGTLKHSMATKGQLRITPTCVGNTQTFDGDQGAIEDHPHLCGEHSLAFLRPSFNVGSPPPVWGTQKIDPRAFADAGITPTCVGNTYNITIWFTIQKDHPHLCGEHPSSLTK